MDGLTGIQRRVWCALVVRHKTILWGGDNLRFASQVDLSEAASLHPNEFGRGLKYLKQIGVVRTVERYVPPAWDGDEGQIANRRDPWHPTRIADDYRLILPESAAGQAGTMEKQERPRTVLETPNGPNHQDAKKERS